MRHPPTAPAGSTPAGVYLAPSGAPSVAAGPLSRVAGNVGTGVRGGVGGCDWTGGPSDRRVRRRVGPRAFLRIPGRKNPTATPCPTIYTTGSVQLYVYVIGDRKGEPPYYTAEARAPLAQVWRDK